MLMVLSKMSTSQSAEANSWYAINKHDTWLRLSYSAIIHIYVILLPNKPTEKAIGKKSFPALK